MKLIFSPLSRKEDIWKSELFDEDVLIRTKVSTSTKSLFEDAQDFHGVPVVIDLRSEK